MSCVLSIGGRKFDVDHFVRKSKLNPDNIRYKGSPRYQTKPEGDKLPVSFLSMQSSKADFDNFGKQIKDTIKFLKKNKEQLSLIESTKGIDFAVLDFGIDLRIDNETYFYQSEIFPNKLLQLAGKLGLSLQLSIYPVDMEANVEKHIQEQQKK